VGDTTVPIPTVQEKRPTLILRLPPQWCTEWNISLILMRNLNEFEKTLKEAVAPNLGNYTNISLGRSRKPTTSLSRYNRCHGSETKREAEEHKPVALPLEPT
jgi:hypothetical protein